MEPCADNNCRTYVSNF